MEELVINVLINSLDFQVANLVTVNLWELRLEQLVIWILENVNVTKDILEKNVTNVLLDSFQLNLPKKLVQHANAARLQSIKEIVIKMEYVLVLKMSRVINAMLVLIHTRVGLVVLKNAIATNRVLKMEIKHVLMLDNVTASVMSRD